MAVLAAHRKALPRAPCRVVVGESDGGQALGIALASEVSPPGEHTCPMTLAPGTPGACNVTGGSAAATLPSVNILIITTRYVGDHQNATPMKRIQISRQRGNASPAKTFVVQHRTRDSIQEETTVPILES